MNRDIYVDEDVKMAIQLAIERFLKEAASVGSLQPVGLSRNLFVKKKIY